MNVIEERFIRHTLVLDPHDPARDTDHGRVIRHVLKYHRICTNLNIITDFYGAKNFRAGAYDYMVTERWMTLSALFARPPECCALEKSYIIADFRGLANNDSHAVIDK